MTTSSVQRRDQLFGFPADPQAVEEYEALNAPRQAALQAAAEAVARTGEQIHATLRIDWWVVAEVPGWEEFMLMALPTEETPDSLDLLGDLADTLHAVMTALAPSLARWLNKSVGVMVATAP
jgi:hypothetical protein